MLRSIYARGAKYKEHGTHDFMKTAKSKQWSYQNLMSGLNIRWESTY